MSLLDQIESNALEGNAVKALRLCVTLGGRARSSELRSWASQELHGYEADAERPSYRVITAPLYIDGTNLQWKVTGQQISPLELPEFCREDIGETVELTHSLPALVEMIATATNSDNSLTLMPPQAATVIGYMNSANQSSTRINALYWHVAAVSIKDVVERVCTIAVELASEMRAGMHDDQRIPSSAVASQAVEVVVNGDHNRIELGDVQQIDADIPDLGKGRKRTAEIVTASLGIIGALIYAVTRFL